MTNILLPKPDNESPKKVPSMSLIQRPEPRFYYEEPHRPAAQSAGIERSLSFLRRRYPIMLFAMVVAGLGGFVYLAITPPVFTASATMLITAREGQAFEGSSVLGETTRDGTWLESEIGILTLERDKIGYAVARGMSSADLARLVQPPRDATALLMGSILKRQPSESAVEAKSRDDLVASASAAIANGLDVKRMGMSYLLSVSFSSQDPQEAVKVANAAADAFVSTEIDSKFQDVKRASDWLQDRYKALGAQTSAAERAVDEFKRDHNIITSDGKVITDQQIAELTARLAELRAKTTETHSKLIEIQSILKLNKLDPASRTISDSLNDPIITELRTKYLELANREADWSVRYGPRHLAVIDIRNKERDILIAIRSELQRIGETYASDYAIAQMNEAGVQAEVSRIERQIPNDVQMELRSLESSAQSTRTFYDNYLLHYTQAVQQESSPFSETQVVARAANAGQSFPSVSRIIALAALAGLGFGVGLGLLQDALDRAFRTKDHVRDTLDAECLAMIPRAKRRKVRSYLVPPANAGSRTGRGENLGLFRGAHIIAVDRPSLFADAIAAIKLAVDLRAPHHPCKVIGFTSSVPREGKSTIATAFAQLSTHLGGRGILVDLDLRHRWLTQSLAPRAERGLLSVVNGQASLGDVVWTDPSLGMAFLPCVGPGLANSCHLLAGDNMKAFFDALRTQYDYVIVDLPPLLPVVDVRATTKLIDHYVFVVEWGQTRMDISRRCLTDVPGVQEKLLGVVLNKVEFKSLGRYDLSGASYYSKRYFRPSMWP